MKLFTPIEKLTPCGGFLVLYMEEMPEIRECYALTTPFDRESAVFVGVQEVSGTDPI